jgi:hypothetical protein
MPVSNSIEQRVRADRTDFPLDVRPADFSTNYFGRHLARLQQPRELSKGPCGSPDRKERILRRTAAMQRLFSARSWDNAGKSQCNDFACRLPYSEEALGAGFSGHAWKSGDGAGAGAEGGKSTAFLRCRAISRPKPVDQNITLDRSCHSDRGALTVLPWPRKARVPRLGDVRDDSSDDSSPRSVRKRSIHSKEGVLS